MTIYVELNGIEVFQDEISEFFDRILIQAAFDLTNELIAATPVDTGFAQSMWVPAVDDPFEIDLIEPNLAVGPAARATGLARIANYTHTMGDIIITNNTEYLPVLNMGRSPQQPEPEWIEATVADVLQDVQRRADRLAARI